MDCSMPGFPVHHQLLEFAQTHLHESAMPVRIYRKRKTPQVNTIYRKGCGSISQHKLIQRLKDKSQKIHYNYNKQLMYIHEDVKDDIKNTKHRGG